MMPRIFRTSTSCARALSTVVHKPLYGTVPSHSSYVFLHSNEPPSEFLTKISSPIQRELQLRTIKLGTIVNFAWTGERQSMPVNKTAATVFSRSGGRLEIPEISLENMDDVEAKLKEHIQRETLVSETDAEVHLYICTHGARDCRCGQQGGQVVRSLREEVERRNLSHRIKVREVGHVGGHRYAANMLVYPHGEWLGQLQADDIPHVVNLMLSGPTRPLTERDPPLLPNHWRGRMGLGKDEQISFFEGFSGQRNK